MDEKEKLNRTIAENVRVRRTAANMTVEELAEKADISPRHLTAIESEKAENITVFYIVSIAKALNVRPEDIIYPIDIQKWYTCSAKEFKDYECVNVLESANQMRTYYPPVLSSNAITSFIELLYVLPLFKISTVYRFLVQIGGELFDAGGETLQYASNLFDRAFKKLPDSPEKRYVERELELVRKKRNGEDSIDDYKIRMFDDSMIEEYKAYYERLEKNYKDMCDLEHIFNNSKLFQNYDEGQR